MLPTILSFAPAALEVITAAALMIVFSFRQANAYVLIPLGLAASITGLVLAIIQNQGAQAFVLAAGVVVSVIFLSATIFVSLLGRQEALDEQRRLNYWTAQRRILAHG